MHAGDRILKVNHAGEFGAICIYTGQIWAASLIAPALISSLDAARRDERRHLRIFADELQKRHLSRCRSYFLCGTGGLFLGVATGLMGPRSIAITTAAVENVVLAHLSRQLVALEQNDPDAYAAISLIVADEQAHHDDAMQNLSASADSKNWLWHCVTAATEAVIWIGMRI
jgi:ubiquinone biosynthesis monooxygenase Coq7